MSQSYLTADRPVTQTDRISPEPARGEVQQSSVADSSVTEQSPFDSADSRSTSSEAIEISPTESPVDSQSEQTHTGAFSPTPVESGANPYRFVPKFLNLEFFKSTGIAILSLSMGVFVWFLASANNFNWFINFENVPGPGKVFLAFLGHLQTDVFYTHIRVSLTRIFLSYSLAVVIGVALGVLMGRSVLFKRFMMPYIEVIRPIPAVAWIPLAILMWPTEESSIIYITFLGALFPIVLNTLHGVEQTPEVLVRASQSLGASRWGIFWHVVLPGALPSIAAGLAIGMGVSWFSLLAGEIISGQYGIGYFTWNAYSLINYQDIVVGMLIIGFLGTVSTAGIKLITMPMLKWQRRTR